ncbi:hypothetical protein RUND412_003315 [Rhizina undulata]
MAELSAMLRKLERYSACDIADALLKLEVPRSGFLVDLVLRTPPSDLTSASSRPVAFPAQTILFAPKASETQSQLPPSTHFADLARRDTIVVVSQPEGQYNAVLGGIIAARMVILGVRGFVVDGRVRDLVELAGLDVDVYSRGVSAVGAGAESRPVAVDVPIIVSGVRVEPNDIVFADPANDAVIAIPRMKLTSVMEILPGIVDADDKVMEDIKKGRSVWGAFKEHRRKA